jgi:flagellar biosynthesis chaperone FliJ
MRRFKWRLQRFWEIKQKQEQLKRAELTAVTERLSQRRGELFMQKRILEDLIDAVSQQPPEDRLAHQAFLMSCSAANDKTIKMLENDIKMLSACQQEKMAELIKMKQFNEGLGKLRAEARTEFLQEQEKLEQKEMDETGISRFARKIMTHSEEVVL